MSLYMILGCAQGLHTQSGGGQGHPEEMPLAHCPPEIPPQTDAGHHAPVHLPQNLSLHFDSFYVTRANTPVTKLLIPYLFVFMLFELANQSPLL